MGISISGDISITSLYLPGAFVFRFVYILLSPARLEQQTDGQNYFLCNMMESCLQHQQQSTSVSALPACAYLILIIKLNFKMK